MENKYVVKPERARGEDETLWYGYKNGFYVRGTTSKSREESVRLLSEKCNTDKSKIL